MLSRPKSTVVSIWWICHDRVAPSCPGWTNVVSTTQCDSWKTSASAKDATKDVTRKKASTGSGECTSSGIMKAQSRKTHLPPISVARAPVCGRRTGLRPAGPRRRKAKSDRNCQRMVMIAYSTQM